MINALQLNPTLVTILKIATYFDCSIDEVVGREDIYFRSQQYKFDNIPLDIINSNLKAFINGNLQKNNLSPYKLGRQIGFSEYPIVEFINSPTKSLSSAVIAALADYFKISIDEMIGRVLPSNQKSQQNAEKIKEPSEESRKTN